MSKKEQKEKIANFIGLAVAHLILREYTLHSESIPKLQSEIENYESLAEKLAQNNWNNYDIQQIKELAEKRCNQKLSPLNYPDLQSHINENEITKEIKKIMKNLGLLE